MAERTCPWTSCRQEHNCQTPGCGPACEGHFCAEVVV